MNKSVRFRGITAIILLLVLTVISIPFARTNAYAEDLPAVFQRFVSDPRWKDGTPWYGSQRPKLSSWSSSGCAAYCSDFVKYCFDVNNPNSGESFYNTSQIRAGDVIILGNADDGTGHWFVVLKRNGNSLYTAEGNYSGRVRIGSNYTISSSNKFNEDSRKLSIGHHYMSGNTSPRGHLDGCTGGKGTVRVCGWAIDDDTPNYPLKIHVYVGGEAGSGAPGFETKADLYRPDPGLNDDVYKGICGFEDTFTLPSNLYGTQKVYVYAIDSTAEPNPLIGEATVTIEKNTSPADKTPPSISNVQVTKTFTGYTVTCDVSDNVGVEKVLFPTWTNADGQDDLRWYVGTLKNGKASFTVSKSNHGNQYGTYTTHIYAYDAAGNKTGVGTDSYPILSVYVPSGTEIPRGALDSCSGGVGTVTVRGWALDDDALEGAISVHVYVGKPTAADNTTPAHIISKANVYRSDLDDGGRYTGYYGYDETFMVPSSLFGEQNVYVYAINTPSGDNPLIGQGKVTVQPRVPHDINIATTENGTVTSDVNDAAVNEEVNLTITPASGYELDILSVKAQDGTTVAVSNNQFTMPAQAVTVAATFKIIKTNPTIITAPTAIKGLVENGSQQALVHAGAASGGTLYYALGKDGNTAPENAWSDQLPTGKDAGTYYVWYWIKGDESHLDSVPVAITTTIAQKPEPEPEPEPEPAVEPEPEPTDVKVHSHTEVTVPGKDPTCTETGLTEGKKCSECGEILVSQEIIEALGHKEVVDKAVVATTESTGLTEGKHCERCGKVLVAQQVTEKLSPKTPEEKINDFVTRCYKLILNRDPDAGGLQSWCETLKNKTATAAQIIDGFVRSPEYVGRNLSSGQSVDILYKTMLNREADADGKASWVTALSQGYSLQNIIDGFCGSVEFTGLCKEYGIEAGSVGAPAPADTSTPRGKIEAFVRRCYQLILSRNADQSGLAGWSDALEQRTAAAAQIIDGFVRSPEYINRNLDNGTSVDILYKTMLDREADAAGRAGWVDALSQGYTLQHIINGFCGSVEFTNICNNFGIVAGNVAVSGTMVKREAITPEGEEAAPVVIGEFRSEYTDEEKIKAFVEHCYKAVFGREGDAEGIENYTKAILEGKKSPKRVAYEFIFSNEFQNNLPGNEDFIRILYRLYFDREADAEGLAGWIQMLEDGASLEDIVNGFAGSSEFKAIANAMKE